MKVLTFIRRQIVPPVALCSFVLFGSQSAQATTTGGRLTVSGTINGTTAVNFSLLDSQIHSGVFRISPCDGISTDAYVLNGGSPNGCDNGDAFETTQAAGNADVSGFHIKTFYQFGGCNTKDTICAGPDTGFLTVTNNTGFAFTGTITLGGTSPVTGAVSDSWTSGLAAGSSVTLALSNESSNDGGFNAGDQCSAPSVGTGTGVVGNANGASTCGLLITVTQVDGSGKAVAFTVAPTNPNGVPANNGNPYDLTEDTLVGVQNNSGASLNSMILTSPDTVFGGLFGFDFDGPCVFNANDCFGLAATRTGYEGPVNTFSNISADRTSGMINFTAPIPNGGSTWMALEGTPASLTPPTMQVQTTPPTNFTTTSTTTYTTVPTVFSTIAGQFNESDVSFAPTADLTFPPGSDPTTMQFQTTNRCVSNSDQYEHDTPFATFKPFDVASNDALCGSPGNGAKYEVRCFDAMNPMPSENDCPFASAPHTHIEHKVIIDSTGGTPPAITPGTTVGYLHWPISPALTASATSWSPSSGTGPGSNPNCTSVTNGLNGTPAFACDIENILITKYGGVNGPNTYAPGGFGSDKRKGDYFLGYNVPEPCSAWKVNGTLVHMPCVQGNSPFFVSSVLTGGLTFDFVGNPAQCPAGMVCGNGWTPAPIKNLFYHFDQCTSAGPDPCSSAPDYPNVVLLQLNEDLNDLATCFAGSSTCPVTSVTQPGTSSTLPVEFTTTPPVPEPEARFLLQASVGDAVQLRDLNIQVLSAGQGQCPDPSPNDPNRPVGGWVPPCYSTKLFNVPIIVDNTAPTVTTPVLNPLPVNGTYSVGQVVTASATCVDPISNGIASGVVKCGKDSVTPAPTPPAISQTPFTSSGNPVPTSTLGKQTFTLSATDQAGNLGTSPGVSFCVGYTITSVDRNGVIGFTQPVDNPGPGPQAIVNAVGSSQAIPLSLTVVDCNGNPVSNLDLVGSTNVGTVKTVVLSATNAPSGTCASAVMDNSISTPAAGSSGWQILGNGVYDYNWKPMAPVGSCIAFSVNLGDTVQHTAYFNVVKH